MILCLTIEMQMMVKVEVKLKRIGRTPVITQSMLLDKPEKNILKNFHWCRWGAELSVAHAQTWERGPPLASAVISINFSN